MGFFLYSIRNQANGKGYIGQTTRDDMYNRWRQHLRSHKSGREPLYLAMRKHGSGNFLYEPMMEFSSQEELDAAEIAMILACETKTHERGYNISPGGRLIAMETRKRISSAQKGRKLPPERVEAIRAYMSMPEVRERLRQQHLGTKASAETRAKMSAARKGKPKSPEHNAAVRAALSTPEVRECRRKLRLGKKHSPETRAKIAAAHKGRAKSPEHRAALSAARTGTKMPSRSAGHRAAISAALLGRPRKSSKLTEEQSREIFELGQSRINCDGELKSGTTIELSQLYGVSTAMVSMIISGKRRAHATEGEARA